MTVTDPIRRRSNNLHVDSRIFPPKANRILCTLTQPLHPDSFYPGVSARLSALSDSVKILKTFEGGEFQIGNFIGSQHRDSVKLQAFDNYIDYSFLSRASWKSRNAMGRKKKSTKSTLSFGRSGHTTLNRL